MKNRYYYRIDRNGTEDEITIHNPEGRLMLSVAFWDQPDIADAQQRKADAELIVAALNAYRPRKPKKKLSDFEKAMARTNAALAKSLRQPMPKETVYKS